MVCASSTATSCSKTPAPDPDHQIADFPTSPLTTSERAPCAHPRTLRDTPERRAIGDGRHRLKIVRDVEMITCEGCGREVDVTRPRGTPLIVERSANDPKAVTVRIGRDEVHRCDRASNGDRAS